MKDQKTSLLISQLTNELFKLKGDDIYPKYKLVDGGERISIEHKKDIFKYFSTHHISEEGVLCDDIETFIKWEQFS